MTTHKGGCHCGRIQFEIEAPARLELRECNCSICSMTGHHHLIVAKSAFNLTQGKDDLSCYTFNSGVAKHYFCRNCGVKSFYIPRSNPDGVSVNARCIEPSTIKSQTLVQFDGQNWQANADSLKHLSED